MSHTFASLALRSPVFKTGRVTICMSSLEKCLFSPLARFLIGSFIFLELSWRSCLYIFEINPLSVASFAIIFYHSEGCLFTLLIVSFAVQKLLSFIRSHLFIIAFISNILAGGHRGSCCDSCRRVFCLCSPLCLNYFVTYLFIFSPSSSWKTYFYCLHSFAFSRTSSS